MFFLIPFLLFKLEHKIKCKFKTRTDGISIFIFLRKYFSYPKLIVILVCCVSFLIFNFSYLVGNI